MIVRDAIVLGSNSVGRILGDLGQKGFLYRGVSQSFFFFFDYPNTLCDSSMDLLHDIPQEPSFHEVPMGQVVCEKPDLRNEMLNQT